MSSVKNKKGLSSSGSISARNPSRKKNKKLDAIHDKITNSAALNGGFDTLIFKIDKIEEGQSHLSTKVDKIHEAIYDPNEGIFSKLSEYKLESYGKFNDITHHMSEINEWKKHLDKTKDKDSAEVDQASEKIVALEKSVDSLVKGRIVMWGLIKWLGVAIGGGLIALVFKWLENKI